MDINDDYYLIVKDILNSDEFIKRKIIDIMVI